MRIHRIFRFRLIGLMIAFTVLTLWMGHLSSKVARERQAVTFFDEHDIRYEFGDQVTEFKSGVRISTDGKPNLHPLLQGLGNEYYREVAMVSVSDANAKTLRAVFKCRELRSLSLASHSLVDDDFHGLEKLSRLDTLSVKCPKVSGKLFQHLSNPSLIRRVQIESPYLTDALQHIETCQNLSHLNIGSGNISPTEISPTGISNLTQLAKLESLTLRGITLSDECWKVLASIPNLKNLIVIQAELSDSELVAISQIPTIRNLNISSCAAGTSGLSQLRNSTSLSRVRIKRGMLSKGEFEQLWSESPNIIWAAN